MDSNEMTGEASGEPAPHGEESCTSCNEEPGVGFMQTKWGGVSQHTKAESQAFSTDVSDTRRQRKRQKFRKRPLTKETV